MSSTIYATNGHILTAGSLSDLFIDIPQNETIMNNIVKAWSIINNPKYDTIMVSVSGGSDSDIIVHICRMVDKDNKCKYVFFDTGLEMSATKKHLSYLEKRYDIIIEIKKALKPIPVSCKQYGQPFISKTASEMIMRLQKHNFKWEDESFENLLEKYCDKASLEEEIILNKIKEKTNKTTYKKWCFINNHWYKGCVQALRWWTNNNGEKSKFNISYNSYLKEFIIKYGIPFKVSNKCCYYSKKKVMRSLFKDIIKSNNLSAENILGVTGVRKAEGGARSSAYKNCYSLSNNKNKIDSYRPVFYYTNKDKQEFNEFYNIKNSDCYSVYKMIRTGCSGCPYAHNINNELNILKQYEPGLYKAVNNVFGDSYKYTVLYKDFQKKQKETEKIIKKIALKQYKQMNIFDFLKNSNKRE